MLQKSTFKPIFKSLVLCAFCFLSLAAAYAQNQAVYYDKQGRQLSQKEVNTIMKSAFSMMKRIDDAGNERIMLVPLNEKDIAQKNNTEQAFVSRLEGKLFPVLRAVNRQNETLEVPVKGKITVINFWFVACKPCVDEMPQLNKLAKKYAEKDVVFIAPALDSSENIQSFLKNHAFDYQILPNTILWSHTLGLNTYPTHILVNPNGIVEKVFVGAAEDIEAKLSQSINKMLAR